MNLNSCQNVSEVFDTGEQDSIPNATFHGAIVLDQPNAGIVLQPRPYAANEDWSGITNQKERKKLQNRLNKRLSRQRRREGTSLKSCSGDSPAATARVRGSGNVLVQGHTFVSHFLSFTHCTAEDVGWKREVLRRFAEKALRSYRMGDPRAEHHLRLIQVNLINGLTRNAAALGFSFDWLICEVISPFGRDGDKTSRSTAALPMSSTPVTLLPTEAQLKKMHHPWLDLLPLPRMRQNLFMAGSRMGPEEEETLHDQLYRDILETGGDQREWVGLAVWGDPWDPMSWEMSQPFARRWAWLIQGCPEIVASTNYWRDKRGEQPIVVPGFVLGEVS